MGPARKVKPDDEKLPPPATIEELWARMEKEINSLRKEMREEGSPWFGEFVRYLQSSYSRYRRSD
jgi:3-methyladenine DNA glycosylase/8-oxoguanine DNA glycosylase